MFARIASYIAFWLIMTCMVVGSAFVVVFLYLPFVVLKALWLKATGRIDEVTGQPSEGSKPAAF